MSNNLESLVRQWFRQWEIGDFAGLPIADDFTHTSPFGAIHGKKQYLDLVEANRDKFLGYRFEIHDMLVDAERACVRYTAVQGDFRLDVSEWHYVRDGLIREVVAYYHIGDIRPGRGLSQKHDTD